MYRDYRQFADILDRYGPRNITVTANVFGRPSQPSVLKVNLTMHGGNQVSTPSC